ncbi:DUF3265 domain-containing protein [Vibrio cholerae]
MRSSGTWHAWHFQFALSLVVTVLCGSFCIACLRPLTRRYELLGFIERAISPFRNLVSLYPVIKKH